MKSGEPNSRKHERKQKILYYLITILGFVALGYGVIISHQRSEPFYKGKSLSNWLDLYTPDPKRSPIVDFGQASEVVRSLGSNAIPTLLRLVRTTDPPLKRKIISLIQREGWIRLQFFRTAEELNQQGALGLQALHASAETAVPALIQIYEARLSPSSEKWSSYALGAIGTKEAMAALLRGVTNSNPQSRICSLLALPGIHAEPGLVVTTFTNAFQDQNAEVRLWACDRFGLLGSETWPARRRSKHVLESLLRDPDARVRSSAANVIHQIESEPGTTAEE